MDIDSSDWSGGSLVSTLSLVSRHVADLDRQLSTVHAHLRACERRIRALESAHAALLQGPQPVPSSLPWFLTCCWSTCQRTARFLASAEGLAGNCSLCSKDVRGTAEVHV